MIEQIGTPGEIYDEPINEYVANFIGSSNIVNGVMKKDNVVYFDEKEFPCNAKGFKENEPVDVVIRPEDIQIKTKNKGKLNGHVISSLFKGVYFDILVETKRGASTYS